MTDQIKDEKEFREFYQDYLDGQSDLSHLYQKSETVGPSDKLDQVILNAAKKQSNKSQLVSFPTKNHTRYYSLAAGIAVFSLVGLLVFNTWEAEQKHIQSELSIERTAPAEADYISPEVQVRMGAAAKPDSSAARNDFSKKELLDDEALLLEEESILPPPAPAVIMPEQKAVRKMSPTMQRFEAVPLRQKTKKQSSLIMADIAQPIAAMTVPEWLLKIDTLISKGELTQAYAELIRFQKAYPKYPLEEKYLTIIKGN